MFKKNITSIEGLYLIEPMVFQDDRGFFLESYQYEMFKEMGIDNIFVQDNHSRSMKGVLRGIHFQKGKYAQAKLVRVLKGAVLDIAVDLRPESKTFGKYESFLLTEENKHMLFIPRGFGHGFVTFRDNTEFFYKCDNIYNPYQEGGIIWNDTDLGIDWELKKYHLEEKEIILSEKDKKNETFSNYRKKQDLNYILILGVKGQLGIEFQRLFDKLGINYFGLDKEELDITNLFELETFLEKHSVTHIINCAAYNNIEEAEIDIESCNLLNTVIIQKLAEICKKRNIYFTTYSTSFVFDGEKRLPYTEEDKIRPLSVYGNSKYQGERYALKYERSLVIRTSWLYGSGNNFCKQLIECSKTQSELKIVDDQISSPTSARDLALFSWLLLKKEKYGLYHFSNDGETSKYDQAKFILEYIGWKGSIHRASSYEFKLRAERPMYSKLDSKKIEKDVSRSIPDWRSSLIEFLDEVEYLWKK